MSVTDCRLIFKVSSLSNLNFSGTKRQTHDSVASVLWNNHFWLHRQISSTSQSPIYTSHRPFKVQSLVQLCVWAPPAPVCLLLLSRGFLQLFVFFNLQEATLSERRAWTQHWKLLTGQQQRAETHWSFTKQMIYLINLTLFNIGVILSLILYKYRLKLFFLSWRK